MRTHLAPLAAANPHRQSHHSPVAAQLPEQGHTEPLNPADLLTDAQVAQLLDVSTKTLATWRSTGRYALPFLRIGARIRYRRQDVAAWLESRRRGAPEAVQGVD